jgi:glycosyltransferase involved in cell wall biosynthesis
MPSILIFCKTLLKGGAEKQALTLSKLLSEKGINVILISWCGTKIHPSNLEFIKHNSIRHFGLNGNMFKKFNAFLGIVKNEDVIIILSYLTKANLLSGICKIFNKKLVTIGGIRTEKLPFYKFQVEKLVHNYLNDGTIFNNFTGRDKFVKRGFIPQKLHVIHNTIHIPPTEIFNRSSTVVNIVSVCRFVRSKDFRTALFAFKKLVEKNPDKKLKYFIVGYGPLEKGIRNAIKKLDFEDEVEVLINPSDIPGIFKSCHIYLSTSLYEGLSNSIMEAMVAGLPVIATDVGDNRYLIKDSVNGFIVPCGKIDLIVEKLEYLTKMEDIRNEFGANSFYIIKNEFSEKKFIDNYFKLFSALSLPLISSPPKR